MKIRYTDGKNRTASVLLMLVLIFAAACGSDNGTKPVGSGTVTGIVRLPFKMATGGQPIADVTVRITTGDFDTTTVTKEDGSYIFEDVPATVATVSARLSTCLGATQTEISVLADDTITVDLDLASGAEFDTIAVNWTGAVQMEIDPAGNRLLLLYDQTSGAGGPALVSIDLTTAQTTARTLDDLDDAYDLKIISSVLAVLNYKSSNGYGLRFVDPATLNTAGEDVQYWGLPTTHAGRLALDSDGQTVFVTHGVRDGFLVLGKVFAVSVDQRQLVDADRTPFDLEFAFDLGLVDGSLGWAYNIAFDPATAEILVANRQDRFITAIDWNHWGNFDRTAGLVIPTPGVRIINMSPPDPDSIGFAAELWGFAGGTGVAAKLLSGEAPLVQYTSGASTQTGFHREENSLPVSANHVLDVVPSRQSWFSLFLDPDRAFQGFERAIEERSLGTMQRVYRFESRFLTDAVPTAFVIDSEAAILYVTYANSSMVELFCLP